jgi:hypothetical protein
VEEGRVGENHGSNASTSRDVDRVAGEEEQRIDAALVKSVHRSSLGRGGGFRRDSTNGCNNKPQGDHPTKRGSFCPDSWITRNNKNNGRRDICSEYKSCFGRDGIEALSLESHRLAALDAKSR